MKWILKFFMLVLMVGVGALFVLKRPDGNPWLSPQIFSLDFSDLTAKLEQRVTSFRQVAAELSKKSVTAPGKIQVYKWQATDGSWTYSDKPPEDQALDFKVMTVDANTNVIPGLKMPTETQKTGAQAASSEQHTLPLPLTASPKEIKQLKAETERLQQVMDQKSETLEQL